MEILVNPENDLYSETDIEEEFEEEEEEEEEEQEEENIIVVTRLSEMFSE